MTLGCAHDMNEFRADPLPRWCRRVVLRRLAASDLFAFQDYRHDEAVSRYQGWEPQPDEYSLALLSQMSVATLFAPSQWVQLAIADRATDMLIGDIGICVHKNGRNAELGYTLCAASQGRGLATEAVAAAIALVFECTAVTTILCATDARNQASIRLLERLGMQRRAARETLFRGEPCTEYAYALERAATH